MLRTIYFPFMCLTKSSHLPLTPSSSSVAPANVINNNNNGNNFMSLSVHAANDKNASDCNISNVNNNMSNGYNSTENISLGVRANYIADNFLSRGISTN